MTIIALAASIFLTSCTETDRKGIGRLAEVANDVSVGQHDYYDSNRLDTDGDGVPDDVDRHPMDRNSIYLPQDNREEDTSHE